MTNTPLPQKNQNELFTLSLRERGESKSMVKQYNILPDRFEELLEYCMALGMLLESIEPCITFILSTDYEDEDNYGGFDNVFEIEFDFEGVSKEHSSKVITIVTEIIEEQLIPHIYMRMERVLH